jgi:hypothetical protein
VKKLIFHVENFGKLHCDNPECGYDLPEPEPFAEELIGFRCPMCGSDMLTRKDYRIAARIVGVVNFINRWFGWLGKEAPPPSTIKTRVIIRGGKLDIRNET